MHRTRTFLLASSLAVLSACVGPAPIGGHGSSDERSDGVGGEIDGPDGGSPEPQPGPEPVCKGETCTGQVGQVFVSGFRYEETQELLTLLYGLPSLLTSNTVTIARDHLDQSTCPDPIGMTLSELSEAPYLERCGFSWFKADLETGIATITLMDQLMIDHPDRLAGQVVRSLAQALYYSNETEAVAAYVDSFGSLDHSQCYACPANGEPCDAVGAGLKDRLKMGVDFGVTVAALALGGQAFGDAGVAWRRGSTPCFPDTRNAWYSQNLQQGQLSSLYTQSFDVYKACGAETYASVSLDAPTDVDWAILASSMNAYLGASSATSSPLNFYASGGIHLLSIWSQSPISGTLSCGK